MKKFLFAALLLLFCSPLFSQNNPYGQPKPAIDTVFPFNIPLLDMDSTLESNSKDVLAIAKKDKEKSPTVIAFWLTTCMPCQIELANYTANYAEWKKQAKFRMYAISTDFPKNFHKIAPMARKKNFPFEVFWDRYRLFSKVMPGGLNGLPQVFVFDKNGKLAYHHKGFRPGDELVLFAKIKGLQ